MTHNFTVVLYTLIVQKDYISASFCSAIVEAVVYAYYNIQMNWGSPMQSGVYTEKSENMKKAK